MARVHRAVREAAGKASFPVDASNAMSRLREALAEVVAGVPGGLRRAADLQKALKLDATLSWQVFKIAQSPDPMALAQQVPGPASMKRFLEAARRHVPQELISTAAGAFAAFEAVVDTHAGDRYAFDSMVSDYAEDAGENVHLKHKRAAFRANSHLWGVQEQCSLSCSIFGPGATRGAVDLASIRGRFGLWRYRPGPPLVLSRLELRDTAAPNDGQAAARRREPLDPAAAEVHGVSLIDDFCSRPLPEIRTHRVAANTVHTELLTGAVGRTSAMTCVLGDVSRNIPSPFDDDDFLTVRFNVRIPAQVLLHDVLLHRSLFDNPRAGVSVYGDERVGDHPPVSRQASERLNLTETVQSLGGRLSALQSPDAPRTVELARWALDRLGWGHDDFHIFRCRVEYPVMPSAVEVRVDFDRPKHPKK